jgi:hypothetical protein
MLGNPGDGQGLADDQDHYHRRSGGLNGLQKRLLAARKVEIRPVVGLTGQA